MFPNFKFILASKSPRRKFLLNQIGLKFKIHPSHIDENVNFKNPVKIVKNISTKKALEVSKFYKDEIIISADTIVVCKNIILGKPKTKSDAIKMLEFLSDKTHIVYTGFAFYNCKTKKIFSSYAKTLVTFRKLEANEIRSYVIGGSPMDKAGAYGIQDDFGAVFVKKINGCYNNVVGLPIEKFYSTLKIFLKNGKKN